jgi:hypothetical protein
MDVATAFFPLVLTMIYGLSAVPSHLHIILKPEPVQMLLNHTMLAKARCWGWRQGL